MFASARPRPPHLYALLVVARGARRGLQEALVNFELLGLGGGGEAILQGDEDGRGLLALEPFVGLHRRLRPDGVRVQVLLEEVGLRRPQGGAGELQPVSGYECDGVW